MKFHAFFLLLSIGLLSACDSKFKRSDYMGGFTTQYGECTDTGDITIDHIDKKIKIGFYCFLKECASMEGNTSQGGFFHLENKQGNYIQGQILPDEAKGTWSLNIKNQSCSGQWTASKN